MPPKPKCGCKIHEENKTNPKCANLVRIESRKIKREILDVLTSKGHLPSHSLYLCMACAEYGESLVAESLVTDDTNSSTAPKKHIDIRNYLEEFIVAIEEGKFNDDELYRLTKAIGRSQRGKIYNDIKDCDTQYNDDEYLKTFKCEEWVAVRNKSVVGFLHGIHQSSGKKSNFAQLMKCIELIYDLRSGFISPFHFSSNLMLYFASGSKRAVNITSACSPSGSYSSVMSWLNKKGEKKIICPPDCDIVTFFDNNQKIERKWRVQMNYKSTSSVITTVLHFLTSSTPWIQKDPQLSPRAWLTLDSKKKEEVGEQLKHKMEQENQIFQEYRNKLIQEKIQLVYQQQTFNADSNIIDNIDSMDDVVQEDNNAEERYTFVPSGHTGERVDVMMGEPCFENPCSYESVELVLDHVMEETGLGRDRAWTIVGCDGLPYVLGSRIIDTIHTCPDCNREFYKEDFIIHQNDFEHAENADHNFCQKYKDILMIPGLGHLEMNMTKAIFKLLWNVGLIDLAKMLGFNSAKALASCQTCASHHKSWQIFEIFFHAMAEEMLVPYCRNCMTENISPTLSGFYDWLTRADSPNLIFMREAVFTYCLALHIFRSGVRKNNSDVISATKSKFSPLFFGLNMPFYMEIFVRDAFSRMMCPPEVATYIKKHESYTVSGNEAKGEGGDFVLEAKNKVTKKLIPAGLPQKKHWTNVCRNVDRLGKIRENLDSILKIKDDDDEDYQYTADITREIFHFRKLIRSKNYFTSVNHTNLSGQSLDGELTNFSLISQENMSDYLNFVSCNDLSAQKKYAPIFILKEDREKYQSICNKTKNELIIIVHELLLLIPSDFKLVYEKKWKTIKNKNKAEIIKFYDEIKSL